MDILDNRWHLNCNLTSLIDFVRYNATKKQIEHIKFSKLIIDSHNMYHAPMSKEYYVSYFKRVKNISNDINYQLSKLWTFYLLDLDQDTTLNEMVKSYLYLKEHMEEKI